MIIEELEKLKQQIEVREDLLPLCNDKRLKVFIEWEDDHFDLHIDRSSLTTPASKPYGFLHIRTDEQTLHQLLAGEVQLRTVCNRQVVEGDYQHILLVEALLFLGAGARL
ncbi:hypothetical protein SAMN05421663_101591 [Terribacillus halophilus]|uniref:SCP-2 sterol transfer family protein n=1 Tax=Terribacillus halophilus TaxID=361279 RepID=A0A1G6JHD3_9BACI|nr:hypothetical protein [Terribacillus halophilus]SDC18091.1 hypothetical protein SAMN05421663_101591 [Terribacillus halophilus]